MKSVNLIELSDIPERIISNIESREVALWIHSLPNEIAHSDNLAMFLGLPWRLVLTETISPDIIAKLNTAETVNDPITRKRGFIQVINTNPSNMELPHKCLPIYLLNGMEKSGGKSFDDRLRKMMMLEKLKVSGVREILYISNDIKNNYDDLRDLWDSGLRCSLNFSSENEEEKNNFEDLIQKLSDLKAANFLQIQTSEVIKRTLQIYNEVYPTTRKTIRIKNKLNVFNKIDITELDDPERPILDWYSIIEEKDLTSLMPDELSEKEFIDFFKDPQQSWRPYSAGLPWLKDSKFSAKLKKCLTRLDHNGVDENCISYISAEPGAGGTTLVRMLAWECAKAGYPVLVAKPLPFVPDALPIVNMLTKVNRKAEGIINDIDNDKITPQHSKKYETPWVIVFDAIHWNSRSKELEQFRNEIIKSGRPVCILMVTDTIMKLPFLNSSVFKSIAELNHAITSDEAKDLGTHLNKYLKVYGKERSDFQWERFHNEHSIRLVEGLTAFWVTLSFWIQGQYDLSESIQEWIYRNFKEKVKEIDQKIAILEIAALSSEREPTPVKLLTTSEGNWPVSLKLEDDRSELSSLGLISFSQNDLKYFSLTHDILGRFLINALFYDKEILKILGFEHVMDPEHLRFLILRRVSQKKEIGEIYFRTLGEDFSKSIFKIDPDHGHANFTLLWKDVLDALNDMPKSLRDTSRIFRHHMAISKRRVSKLDNEIYSISELQKRDILLSAIEDITYALEYIDPSDNSEPNVNLYNSLANAYLDLSKVELTIGASNERLLELRALANEFTRKAYQENPNSRFVIETYVKNLLSEALISSPEIAIDHCISALGTLYSALNNESGIYRNQQLSKLADEAIHILFQHTSYNKVTSKPSSPLDLLIGVWKIFTNEKDKTSVMNLTQLDSKQRSNALELLSHDVGKGNMQVIRLKYDLICIDYPNNFKEQLNLIEQLQVKDFRILPQLTLEYAILLYLNNRYQEGEELFKNLRKRLRENEQFVQVPERLHWLRNENNGALSIVHAIVGSSDTFRPMALVQEFRNQSVPFRMAEFGIKELKPREALTCYVSFGHNGPFLRPVTIQMK